MKAILLASGQSSRMKPLSDKNLLSLCDKPLLLHIAENAQKGGVSSFVVVANEENESTLKDLCTKDNALKSSIVQVQEGHGQDKGVKAGLLHLGDDEPVLVLCANDYVDPSAYKAVIEATHDYDGAILAKSVDQYFPGGYLSVNDDNLIESIVEKPGEGNEPSDIINIVVHGFFRSGDLKAALKEADSSKDDVYEVGLQSLFNNKSFKAVRYQDYWQAVKYPWHMLRLMELVIKNEKECRIKNEEYSEIYSGILIHKSAQIAESAVLQGENLIIDEGAKIFHNAVISGPCYIGKGSIVGNNALVRESMLEAGASAGYNTEIARSYIGPRTTSHIAYIGDSIVDSDCNFGAFSCTANLRLDKKPVKVSIKDERINSHCEKLGAIVGKGAQIGIHSCLMPGCKIEENGLVNPGETHK